MSPGPRIYCDYNATAPLRPEAKAAVVSALESTGNPSSVHAEGRKARALVEAAREQVAAAIGACRDDIAFVSGGTEAVAAPIWGALNAMQPGGMLASAIEHEAVASIVERLKSKTVAADAAMDDFLNHPKDPERKSRMEAESRALGDWPSAIDLKAWPVGSDGRVDLDFLSVVMKGAAS